MAEEGHVLVGVLLSNGADGIIHPVAQGAKAFALTGRLEAGVGVIEEGQLLALEMAHLTPGQILPVAHVDFTKAGVEVERQVLGTADRTGRELGADEVTGVDGIDGDGVKPLLQCLNLALSIFGDQRVVPAVDAAVEVALRLRMANEIDCCHVFSVPFYWVTKIRPCSVQRESTTGEETIQSV